ncbi:maltase A2-like [Sergentomyia squamirostris]
MKTSLVFICVIYLINGIQSDLNWWRNANFYQIYPRSFQDSNGDGVGDLNGITSRLPYLKDLGIHGVWISPIFTSPMADIGYDISDFYNIHHEYGTLNDFDRLVGVAHDLGLKILLDFVPNHSSSENEWFKKSAINDDEYKDFYTWHPGREDPENPAGRKLPPSNWRSVFRGSAWTYHEGRQEYYLHQFATFQPDLNYRNPAVVDRMKGVLRFWLDRGVDGFRVDAVPNLFEVLPVDGHYPDEPLSGITTDPDSFDYVQHIYTVDQPETVEMLYQFREVLDEYTRKDGNMRVMMSESDSEINLLMTYYGNGIRNGSHVPFNFYLLFNLDENSNAEDFLRIIRVWLDHIPKGQSPNWLIGNHDRNRTATRFGSDRVDLISMIINTLPGISITYYGDEIGMTNVFVSWEESKDTAACSSDSDHYQAFTRDPARTPFQWDSSTSAGFSTNIKPWLPVSPSYREVNAKVQKQSARSHLKVYKKLLKLRTTETLMRGETTIKTNGKNVLTIVRQLSGHETYITVANIGSSRETVDLRTIYHEQLTFHIVSMNSKRKEEEKIHGPILVLEPRESVVLKGY